MADVFISYARPDRAFVEMLSAQIESAGYSVWWDHALVAGAQFSVEIERELANASAVVVIWSAESVKSTWVRNEAEVAATRSVLVPIRRGNVNPPLPHRLLHTLDFSDWPEQADDTAYPQLLKALDLLRLRTRVAYEKASAARVAGRVDAADRLLEIMRAGGECSDDARLHLAHHEFARLGDHAALPTLRGLRRDTTGLFVRYALDLLIGLCRIASNEPLSTIQELEECRNGPILTVDDQLIVALHEILVFGAIHETDKLEVAWTTLTRGRVESSAGAIPHPAWREVRAYDRAVTSVLYGDQEIKTVVEQLQQPLHRGLIHLAAANSRLARKSTPVLSEIALRARKDGWKRQPTVTQLRQRLRNLEKALLPSAGTLFASRG